jgi:hypothetical protein
VRKRVVAQAGGLAGAAGLGIAFASSALPSAGGCYTHNCDAHLIEEDSGDWEMNASYTFETSPLLVRDGGQTWLNFPGMATLHITFPPDVEQTILARNLAPTDFQAFISTSSQPNVDNAGFTPAAGSLAVFSNVKPTGFLVTNQTCAAYFARFVVGFSTPSSDASTEGSVEASADGSAEISADASADR